MDKTSSEQSLKLYVVLARATRALNDYQNEFFHEQDLNPTEFAVLELLYHKGEQPLQKIGGRILLASGSITYVVDKLEKKGLIRRNNCPKDRRVTYGQITEKGKKFMDEIFPIHEARIDEIMNVLSPDEKQMAIDLLKRVGQEPARIKQEPPTE